MLYNVVNNAVQLPVLSHSSGSGSIVLGVSGTALLAVPPPFRITLITQASYNTAAESLTIFGCTAVATNTPASGQCTLTVTVLEGTADRAYSSGDFAECRETAGAISDLNTAVNALVTEMNGPVSGMIKGSGGKLVAATAGTDYITGNQTITLSGDVTGSGTTAITTAIGTSKVVTAHIAANAVTNAKMAASTANSLAGYNGSGAFSDVIVGSGLSLSGGTLTSTGSGGSVTTVSVASANGFGGTVATATTTPAITITTSVTGLLKGDGTGVSAAVAGTDYLVTVTTGDIASNAITDAKMATSTANTLAGYDGSGNFSSVAVGSGLSLSGGNLTSTGGSGTVTSVALTTPSWLSVGGSPVTTSGTLAITAASGQTANQFLASPSGSTGAVSLRAIVAADMPIFVGSGVSHATGAVPDPGSSAGTSRYLCEDGTWTAPPVNGTGPPSRFPATPVASSGALSLRAIDGADLPNPSSSTLGGVRSAAAVSHQWIDSISTSGVPHLSQPAFSDISGTASASQLPTTGLTITQHAGTIITATDGATVTFDLSLGDWQTVTLGGSRTLALSSPTTGQQFTLILKQDATGSRTVTWFSGITWFGSPFSAPTLPTTAAAYCVVTLKCIATNTYLAWWLGNSAT